MLPILQVGPLALQTPGLILLASLWIGLSISERYAKLYKVKPDHIYNLIFTALVAGVLGARLMMMVSFPSAFIENPSSIISLNPSLLDPAGGFAIALIASFIYVHRNKIAIWSALDALTPTFAVLYIAIALASLASGSAFGSETTLPWAIELWGASRHPSQIYQAVLGGLILWAIWPSRKNKKVDSGVNFLKFSTLTAGAILFLEAFRGDSVIILGGIRSTQVFAWLALAASLWIYFYQIDSKER